MSRYYLVVVIGLIVSASVATNADTVEYLLSVDDYGQLFIDEQLRASYDDYPQGGDRTDPLDLTPGWHDIEIIYKNRWGSNCIGLYEVTGPDTGDLLLVPKERLRSTNDVGATVSGLKADYYGLDGTYVKTVYGEGPIHHSWYNLAPSYILYETVPGVLWGGIYDGWSTFEERLSGQILIGPDLITVAVDIKPGSYPNAINLGANGVIPVAILSDTEFDATTADPERVSLAGAGVAVRGKGSKYLAHQEDVNADELMDLVVQVETENLDPTQFQDGHAIVTGMTYDGVAFEGQDEIIIVPLED